MSIRVVKVFTAPESELVDTTAAATPLTAVKSKVVEVEHHILQLPLGCYRLYLRIQVRF
jgi:hypothetical protein